MDYLISIYITNYNYYNFIEQAIQSVLSQKDVSFELIIIDDGSTDNSKEIIEKYRALENVTIIYQQNKGLNVTNNIALNIASGKYIMRLDADDYLEPDALKTLSSKLEGSPTLGLVFPDYYIVDEAGNILEHHKRHDFRKEVSLYDQAAHGACTMIRTNFLKALGGYNENYKCQDGYELWVKFIHKYEVENVSQPLFNYRQHGSNLTGDENRILGTRAQINADFVSDLNIENSAIAILPIRSLKDKFINLKWNETTLLNNKIKQAIQSNAIKKVVLSCPDKDVLAFVDEANKSSDKFYLHLRSLGSADHYKSLDQTVEEILLQDEIKQLEKINALVILDITYPLLNTSKINDAINTMLLFRADSLISVRPENGTMYQHDGSGMKSIFQNETINKFERDVIYKHVGGITSSKFDAFQSTKRFINGKVGHIILDKNSAYKIEYKLDLEIAKSINDLYKIT